MRMPSASLARTFRKSTPGFGGDNGAGLTEPVRPAGKLSPGRRAWEKPLGEKGGGKPLGQGWDTLLTVHGAVDRSGPTPHVRSLRVAPGF